MRGSWLNGLRRPFENLERMNNPPRVRIPYSPSVVSKFANKQQGGVVEGKSWVTTKAVTSSRVMSLESDANMHRFKLKIWMMDALWVVTMSRVLSQTKWVI